MKLQLADFAPYLGMPTTDKKLQDFLLEFDAIDALKIKIKPSDGSSTHYVNKKMQYELYFEEKEAIDPITKKEKVCFESVSIPLDKPYKAGLIDLPQEINHGIQRKEVIGMLGGSSASFERNGNVMNDRWFYDAYKIVITYYPSGDIKAITLTTPEDPKR